MLERGHNNKPWEPMFIKSWGKKKYILSPWLRSYYKLHLLRQGTQFHVSPCHCFLPQLSPERHMTCSVCYSHLCLCAFSSTSAKIQIKDTKIWIFFRHSHLSHQHTHISSHFLFPSLPVWQEDTLTVASVHCSEATASCGELYAVLSFVHVVQDRSLVIATEKP